MNKYGIIKEIEEALNNSGYNLKGALSVDMPIDKPYSGKLFIYDTSYSTFSRTLIGLFNLDTKEIEQVNF